MRHSRFKFAWLLLGTGAPSAAYAHGEQALVYPILAVLLTHLIPAVDLLRKGAWGYAAFFVFSQPLLWGMAIAIGAAVAFVGQAIVGENAITIAVIVGVLIFAIAPFFYWRFLLRWVASDAA